MKYIKKYESISIPKLKKYVIWRSHPDSETYHIVEIFSINNDSVKAKISYYYNDKRNRLEEHQNSNLSIFPLELFLPENILDQSDNLEDMKNRIVLIKSTNKYNI